MHKKAILVLVFLSVVTFGNCLRNNFVGDDSIFTANSFYEPRNIIKKLLGAGYISSSDAMLNHAEENFGSGGVSYRPVAASTYFIDSRFWPGNPVGYHAQNFILHIFNTLLVYFLAVCLLSDPNTALVSAVIFSVHPLNTEPVCAIGYRADPLAAFFCLLTCLCYVRFRRDEKKRGFLSFLGAHIFFFLALFTKESAVVLPAILWAYDRIFHGDKPSLRGEGNLRRYIGFLLLLLFYAYVYFFVYSNKTITHPKFLGGHLGAHVVTIFWIWAQYGLAFIFPWTVKSLPPLYLPSIGPLGGDKTWLALGILAVFVVMTVRLVRIEKSALFFAVWILLSLIPVSNIIPIVNPMAYRFMYIPLIGMSVLLAIFFVRIFPQAAVCVRNRALARIIQGGFVGSCIVMTVLLNQAWKNPYTMAAHMHRDFPDSPIGCLFLAEQKIGLNHLSEAKALLEQGMALGLDDARGYFYLGICETDPARSKEYFEEGIRRFPLFAKSYLGLGRQYLLQNRPSEAIPYFEKCLMRVPHNDKAYGYLIQCYLMTGQISRAQDALRRAWNDIPDPSRKALQKMFTAKAPGSFPKDLGI